MSAEIGPSGVRHRARDFPSAYYAAIRLIDGFSDVTGKLIALSMLFLVVSITYEVVARYLFRAPTIWVFEASYMVNGAAFMLGCAYALHKGAHVRTDIFWEMYSERTKGVVDLLGGEVVRAWGAFTGEYLARRDVAVPRLDSTGCAAVHDPGHLRSSQVRVPDPLWP